MPDRGPDFDLLLPPPADAAAAEVGGGFPDQAEPAWPLPALLLLLVLGYGAAAMLSIALSREPGSVANVWYANALAAVLLVRQPLRHWPWLLAGAGLANMVANGWWGDGWSLIGLLLLPNLLEVALAGWLLRRAGLTHAPLRTPAVLLRVLLRGALLPQLVAATLVGLLFRVLGRPDAGLVALTWLEGSAIGAVSVLPLGLSLARQPWVVLGDMLRDTRALVLLPLAVGLALLCMASMPYPFVYVALPLIAAAMLLDSAAVALLTLVVSLTVATALGTGVLLPPPATAEWELGLVYLAVAAVLVPALLLSAAVTAWRADNNRLRQRSAELEQAHAGLRQFVHAASHDLRGPLNAITQFNALVQADHGAALPEQARVWLAVVDAEAVRMRGLLDDVLQYAQVQRLSLPPAVAVPLDAVLASRLAALPPPLRACVQVAALPVVAGHGPSLELLFEHLLANALKFVPPGCPPQVRVLAAVHEGWATVSVIDQGIGMAPDAMARLFKPFQRLQRHADYPGTGLGLAICQQLVTALGGEIVLRSRPGQGTRVLVRLPLWAAEGPSAP
ncbi:sensor histidine kinase [Aquabacterium sp. OR-4]|uniref:sensor histidine kinase n=1 Tax=Aquabacterium sp. OR-4 TaxID=2978127 RepID=UPI0028CA55B4|nr:ATP-binding protein [Aquabacterium sp. OR-4]MDT7834602.1 ATP-binding protein [Aquabacterium sp. OR-4]